MAGKSSYRDLGIPESENTVVVQALDTTNDMVVEAECFVDPVLPGHELFNLPTIAFLIHNKRLGKKLIFDCGMPRDWWNMPPKMAKIMVDIMPGLHVKKNVDEVLTEAQVQLDSIDYAAWSHSHPDHRGDPRRWHKKTQIVVGPGFMKTHSPGWPANDNSSFLEEDFKDRSFIEISFDSDLRIGAYQAHDFFGDGSFYLLDTPGHDIGHVVGLARTTPTTFMLFGGDICHYPGLFRPSKQLPLDDPIPATANLDKTKYPSPCPRAEFASVHPRGADLDSLATTPFYRMSFHKRAAHRDPAQAQRTVEALVEIDSNADCFVCIGHDPTLLKVLPLLNVDPSATVNDWQGKGYKQAAHWGFLNELPRNGTPGQPQLVEGVWRDGKRIDAKA